MAPPACTNCKFFRRGGFFGLLEPICAHPKCVDKGFTSYDRVTGKETTYETVQDTCWRARMSSASACGPGGLLHQPKD